MTDDTAEWTAFAARDRRADGRFVVAVHTTGIYCKPSCPARRPKRENVTFFSDETAARAAGFRACRRCLPDDVARDQVAVARALDLLAAADPPALSALAATVGYAPHHFHRLFKRATGITPAAYARALRTDRAADALARGSRVTDAIYDAGYAAPSRFYEAAAPRLGMSPAARGRGGAGETIAWTMIDTSLGALLVAATRQGLCHLGFGENPRSLARRFPGARVEPGDDRLATLARSIAAAAEAHPRDEALPHDACSLAFREAMWQAAQVQTLMTCNKKLGC